jgi:hypothetical protein
MNSATSKTRNQGETGSKRSISRTGSLGRAMDEIEPQQLSQSDLAYLRFFLLALHSSMKEVRHSVANRALVMDVCVGIDLLIENAGRRFGFPLLPPGHQVIPPGPRQHLVNQLTLEATPPAAPTFNVQCSTFNAQRSMLNVQCSTFNAQRSMLNVQCSTFNAQRSMLRLRQLASARNQP